MSDIKEYLKNTKSQRKRFRRIAGIFIILFLTYSIFIPVYSVIDTYILEDSNVSTRTITDPEFYAKGETVSTPFLDITVTDIRFLTSDNENKHVEICVSVKNTSDKKQTTNLNVECFANHNKAIIKEANKAVSIQPNETKFYTYTFTASKDKTNIKIKIISDCFYYNMKTNYQYWYKYTLTK